MKNPKNRPRRVFRSDPPGVEIWFSGEDRRKLFCNRESLFRSFHSLLQSELVVNHRDATEHPLNNTATVFFLCVILEAATLDVLACLIRNTQEHMQRFLPSFGMKGGGGEMGEKEAMKRGWNEGERFAECSMQSLRYNPCLKGGPFLSVSVREMTFYHPSFIMFTCLLLQPQRQQSSVKVFARRLKNLDASLIVGD